MCINRYMKTYIIYNEQNQRSKYNANDCLNSFHSYKGWEPELYNGCWKNFIRQFQNKYGVYAGDRTKHTEDTELTKRKYATFYSHYSLWHLCLTMNEPIAIVENDTRCTGDLTTDVPSESAMIQLTTESMLNPSKGVVPHNTPENYYKYKNIGTGLHRVFFVHPHGHKYLAGNTGYIITPLAAKYLVQDCIENGWTQNDVLISDSDNVRLYYTNPSPIEYLREKELKSSSR